MESPELRQKLQASLRVLGKALQGRAQQRGGPEVGCEGAVGRGRIRKQKHRGYGDRTGRDKTAERRGD
jgi:hypothetical protein